MIHNKKIRLLMGLVAIALICFLPTLAMAQALPPDNPDAPIDGGLSLLLAAGVGYGVKKVRDNRKKGRVDSDSK